MIDLSKIIDLSTDYQDYKNGEIIRYNGKHKIKQESIAEHSFMVAMNIIKVCALMEIDDTTRDTAVTMAILHDISERFVGDIAYEFKSDSDNKHILRELFDNYEEKLYNKKYKEEIGSIYEDVIQGDNSICDRLVKLGDSMSVVQYSTREIELGNISDDMSRISLEAINRVMYDYKRLEEVLQ